MISRDIEAKVIALFHTEKWQICEIARELGIHHATVSRVLDRPAALRTVTRRPSKLDRFTDFIVATLERYPKIKSSRIHAMLRERGYVGGQDHIRHVVRRLRKTSPKEAFLRLNSLPGEEAQVDWAHFGRVMIGRAERPLVAFAMVLSYSRRLFFRFFVSMTTVDFIRGHVMAFSTFGGCPRRVLYDNLKSAVIDRRGDAIHFNADLLSMCTHYRIEPRPVGIRRGNEKGRVERAIGYIRTAFFEGLGWTTLDELNDKAATFCATIALERRWPQDESKTVAEAVAEESGFLLALPETPFPIFDREEATARRTPYIRFDRNDYSIPHDRVGRTLSVIATTRDVRILDGIEEIAVHTRSYDRGAVIEDREHIQTLLLQKRRARKGASLDRLARLVPESVLLMKEMVQSGSNVGSAVLQLDRMLDLYGAEEMRSGVRAALERRVFHPHAVRLSIEKRRSELHVAPTLDLPIADDPRFRGLEVVPQNLADWERGEKS